jgi:hypothetical protein
MPTLAPALAAGLLMLASLGAFAQAKRPLPVAVQKAITEMMQECRGAGGKPVQSPGLLTIAELTADGLPDFVIDQGAFVCDGAASLFSGSGGSQMSVFVGTPDGQAAQAFASGSFGVKVEQAARPAKLLVMVGGQLCGQKVSPRQSRAELRSCWRPVLWNAGARKMDFAPVSQVQPVQ